MIEGLKFKLTGAELVELCRNTADYHLKKVELYATQLEVLGRSDEEIPEGYTSHDPKRDAMRKVREHERQHKQYKFLADHVVSGDEYILSLQDLHQFF